MFTQTTEVVLRVRDCRAAANVAVTRKHKSSSSRFKPLQRRRKTFWSRVIEIDDVANQRVAYHQQISLLNIYAKRACRMAGIVKDIERVTSPSKLQLVRDQNVRLTKMRQFLVRPIKLCVKRIFVVFMSDDLGL